MYVHTFLTQMSHVFDDIDTSEWPILKIVIANPPISLNEIDLFQAKFLALLDLAKSGADGIPAQKICIIMALDGILHASLEHQIRAASFIKDVREHVSTSIYCTALVIENEIVRQILSFIIKIQPLQSHNKIFTTMEEALQWSRKNRARQLAGLEPTYDS